MKKLHLLATMLSTALSACSFGDIIKLKSGVTGQVDPDTCSICFFDKKLKTEDIKEVIEYCKENSVTWLALENCGIDDDGATLIGKFLRENLTLEGLDLSDNCNITDEGAKVLSCDLEKNKKLQSLYLDNCSIGNRGVVLFWNALLVNDALEKLSLKNNRGINRESLKKHFNIDPDNVLELLKITLEI